MASACKPMGRLGNSCLLIHTRGYIPLIELISFNFKAIMFSIKVYYSIKVEEDEDTTCMVICNILGRPWYWFGCVCCLSVCDIGALW